MNRLLRSILCAGLVGICGFTIVGCGPQENKPVIKSDKVAPPKGPPPKAEAPPLTIPKQ